MPQTPRPIAVARVRSHGNVPAAVGRPVYLTPVEQKTRLFSGMCKFHVRACLPKFYPVFA